MKVSVQKVTGGAGIDRTVFIASIPILDGRRKAAGLGETELDAVIHLAEWLARAGSDFDLTLTTDVGSLSTEGFVP